MPIPFVSLKPAEQLSWGAWGWCQWRTRRAGGLIITTHRGGRLPTLWECRTSAALLAGIGADLLAVDREVVWEDAHQLHDVHGGNLRDALRAWYDSYATVSAEHSPAQPLVFPTSPEPGRYASSKPER